MLLRVDDIRLSTVHSKVEFQNNDLLLVNVNFNQVSKKQTIFQKMIIFILYISISIESL